MTCRRSPEVSSTAFDAQPPDLPPVSLMDMGFAISCPLARHRRPRIRFLFIGSRLCSTLLSDPASRRRPCASLSLHLHQVVKRTFTFELSNMLGTQTKAPILRPGLSDLIGRRPTLPHTCACSTIGAEGLNFRVRDGNGWDPHATITQKSLFESSPR